VVYVEGAPVWLLEVPTWLAFLLGASLALLLAWDLTRHDVVDMRGVVRSVLVFLGFPVALTLGLWAAWSAPAWGQPHGGLEFLVWRLGGAMLLGAAAATAAVWLTLNRRRLAGAKPRELVVALTILLLAGAALRAWGLRSPPPPPGTATPTPQGGYQAFYPGPPSSIALPTPASRAP
jgi:hypothetical protein